MANPHLITFIQSLSPIEVRLVEDHLNKTQALVDPQKEEAMEVKLFKYLVTHKKDNVTDEQIIIETATKRVSDLKNNLFNKVLEALTLDKYITNTSLVNENDIIIFSLKKKLLACKVSIRIVNEGKTEAIHELLNDIINKAKEYELYDIIVEALILKKYFKGIRFGLKDFDKINEEVKFYEYCVQATFGAADKYYRLILDNDFIKTLSNAEVSMHITNSIKEMEIDYKKTKSEQVNYYLHIFRFALFERQKNYAKAIEQCNKLISILEKNKAIYRKERMGSAFTNLSSFKIQLGNYAAAVKEARHAQKYYQENSLNYAISKEQEFYANFCNENYSDANKCVVELLNHSTIDTGEFRKSKFIYYQVCTLFAQKNFSGALRLLNEALEIEKDKSRWNVSIRILTIMIFIELNKINEAFTSIESLRKHVERTGKTDGISERDILIVKLLRELEKEGFEYSEKNANASKMLKQLSDKDSKTAWQHYSSELIKFHEWLESKK